MRGSLHGQRGLTLLEMVVVLVILIALAGAALQASTGLADEGRYEGSRRTLEAIDLATVGSSDDREPDGSARLTGFVADMGRLPVSTSDGTDATLEELLTLPSGATAYGLKDAPALTFSALSLQAAGEFVLGAGWRGPYVRLGVGVSELRDGWGNKLVLLSAADDSEISGAGTSVGAVRSLGSDGADGGTGLYSPDLDVQWLQTGVDRVSASVGGSVDVRTAGVVSDPLPTDTVFVVLFGPASDGTVGVTHKGGSGTTLVAGDALAAPYSFTLSSTVGPRVLRVFVVRGGVAYASQPVRLVLAAGGQTRDLIVDIP